MQAGIWRLQQIDANQNRAGDEMTVKKKRWLIAVPIVLAVLFIFGFCYRGYVGNVALCSKPRSPLVWLFVWNGEQGRALGNKSVVCEAQAITNNQIWKPFALHEYSLDQQGICYNQSVRHIINLSHVRSASKPDFRLDKVEAMPFYQADGYRSMGFTNTKLYCGAGKNTSECVVEVVPLCLKQIDDNALFPHYQLSLCNDPELAIEMDNMPAYEGLNISRIIFANEKKAGNFGFRYSVTRDAWPLEGDIAIVEAGKGHMRCYYRQSQIDGINGNGRYIWRDASQAEGMRTCMSLLAETRRSCFREQDKTGPHHIEY